MSNIESIARLISYFLNLNFNFFGFDLKYIYVVLSCFSFWFIGRMLGGGKGE